MARPTRQRSLFSTTSAQDVAEVFDAERLTQARVLAAKTKQELAELLGVSPAAIGQYESKIVSPRADHVEKMAEVLDVPISFFATGRPHTKLDASMAHFRSLRSTRASQRAKAIALTEQLWELAYAIERRIELPPVDLPDLGTTSQSTSISPQEAAHALRCHWGIQEGPFPHLVRTMELNGVIVSILSMARDDQEIARVDAFSTSRSPRPLVILTPDRADDIYRHRFTAAHELGHLILHADAAPGDIQQEREADQFAAELLTPAAEIEDELPTRIRIPLLQDTGRRWGVSADSLVRRCKELGIASETSARRGYQRLQQLRSAGLLRPEPVTGFPGEIPSLLPKAFDLAVDNGLELSELARELAWPVDLIHKFLGKDENRPKLRLVQP